MSPWWPVALCGLAVVALLWAERAAAQWGIWLAKPIAASAFVWLAWTLGAADTVYGRRILVALLCCWLGDVLLIPRRGLWFRLGILAFLVGHLAFAVAFLSWPVAYPYLLAGCVVMGLFAWRVGIWLIPHLQTPQHRAYLVPVRLYTGVISAMVAVAIAVVGAGAPPWVLVGAVLFAASDLSVAKRRFVEAKFLDAAWGLPLYFGAQLILASSVALV